MKYADRLRYASMISQAAQKWLAGGLEAFKRDEKMIKAYRADAADLREIAGLLRKGEVASAANKAMSLDTIVRDCIPNDAYYALDEAANDAYEASKDSSMVDFDGKTVVFTGFRDLHLANEIVMRGGRVTSAVSNQTDIVVAYDTQSTSGKAAKARNLGVKVISYVKAQTSVGM